MPANTLSKEDLINRTYQFLLEMIPRLEKLPRNQKFLIADRIENLIMDLLNTFIEAYYVPKDQKPPRLAKANLQIEQLRFLIRLCHDLQYYSHSAYGYISEKINEIGKMNGGWWRSLQVK